MLHLGDRHRRVLDAEVGHAGTFAAEVGDQRVVGIERELAIAGELDTIAAQRSAIVSSSP